MKEKSSIANKIYTVCFLGLMMLFGIASVVLFISNHLPTETKTGDKTEMVSFSQQYPFAEDVQNPSDEIADFGFAGNYLNLANRVIDSTKHYLTALNPLSFPLKKLINPLTYFISGDIVMTGSNAIIKLPNGYLAECFTYCPSLEAWNSILDFSTWLKEKDIPFVSLITPDKSDDSVTVFPTGVPHGYTQTIDEYKAFMDKNDITYIEAKNLLLAKNDDLYSWFFQTDHHWNVHAAFLTAQKTAEYLTDMLSLPTETGALANDNFELAVYPNSFIGSYGRKIGDARKEAMEVLYPKTETDFHIEIPGNGINKTGSFADTLIDQSLLDTADSSYSAFLYGDLPLIRIENNNCQNGTRVLVIKHSFADSFCPYFANTVQYLDIIDPRYFDGSIRSYIEQTNPDVVLLCMDVAIEGYENSLRLK